MAVSNSSYLNKSYKRETDREKMRRLYNYMSIIEESIRFFDKGKYNSYMERLKVDTGFHFTFKSHYEAYNVLKRCMNEGAHNLDITDDEYDQLDSIANSPLTNASAWAAAYLLGINKNDEHTSIDAVVSNQLKIELYPNPANDYFTLEFENSKLIDKEFVYSIFDMNGKVLIKQKIQDKNVDVSFLQNGIYLLTVEVDGSIVRKSFVIER